MASLVISPTKFRDSTVPVVVDFTSRMADGEAVVAVVCSMSVSSGVDPAPEDMLEGSVDLFQNVATQFISNGLVGVIYLMGFAATTNIGNELIINTYIAVTSSNPFQAL